MFTLFYMYSTILQWWRLSRLRTKLSGTLNSHNALMICTGSNISDPKNRRCLENLLFHNDDRIGCTVVPKQQIDLRQWAAFPKDLSYFPIFFTSSKATLNSPRIYIFLQAQLNEYHQHQGETIHVENYGELIAWRTSDYFEMVLKTDMNNLTKLVNCFCDHSMDINHELQLLRIETIDIEGNPLKIKYELRFPLEQKLKYSFAPVHWKKFANDVRSLYSKFSDHSSNKILDHPTIKIESSSSKLEELKTPETDLKVLKKSPETTKHHHKPLTKENKNKLEVAQLDTRRPKSNDRKHKIERSKENADAKKKEAKPKITAEDKQRNDAETSSAGDRKDKTRAPKLVECSEHKSKSKLKKVGRHRSKEGEYKKLVSDSSPQPPVNGYDLDGALSVLANAEGSETQNGVVSNLEESKVEEKENVMAREDMKTKPPNVLVYADSVVARDNVKNVLHSILNNHKYIIYDFPMNSSELWKGTSTALIVVCGNVPADVTSQLLEYLVTGGKLLCLCSDFLYSVLHIFSTAEVRERELVRFSYDNWKRVRMMHHVFCYQASPAKRQFSKDSDQSNHSSRGSSPVAPRMPSAVEIQHNGKKFIVQVQVLGAEETWHTPSLLLASVKNSKGTAIFSQVHLEIDPTQYQDDDSKYSALKESNQARLEILKHILSQYLSMDCTEIVTTEYAPGYFLGMHNRKQEMLAECCNIVEGLLVTEKITVKFCGKGVEPEPTTAIFLPVLIHACPTNFSTVKYFETLETETIGRLVVYVDILTSSQFLITKTLKHGFVVIVKQQTQGAGRSGNKWLSPMGCAMFSMQLHIPMNSTLGKSLPLVQHLVMVAVVAAVKNQPGCEDIALGLKWPNDLYANGVVKIGGLVVNSTISSDIAIVNIGCGVNLNNIEPTTCINQVIRNNNAAKHKNVHDIPYEKFFAIVFNEVERIYNRVQEGNLEYLFELYYKYWLHSNAEITVNASDGRTCQAKIIGIDEYGFLKVQSQDGTISNVQPDGNSFDMMKGLVAPKIF